VRLEELKAVFDRQAPGYDKQWEQMAPIRDALHFLLESVFAELPDDARILCVGVGTGAEIAHLARKSPSWRFMAVDPSPAMLAICRARADAEGYAARFDYHEGYVDTLSDGASYAAATCFLVSQFIVTREARVDFFRAIARKLAPGGVLATSDLASDAAPSVYEPLLRLWLNVMTPGGARPERVDQARAAYAKDVAILPPAEVASIIAAAGFEPPVPFYQAGLLHAWFAKRAAP
jgi:tRNA (cmo5U34)-methyltransferase